MLTACEQSKSRQSQYLYGAFGSALSISSPVLEAVKILRNTDFHTSKKERKATLQYTPPSNFPHLYIDISRFTSGCAFVVVVCLNKQNVENQKLKFLATPLRICIFTSHKRYFWACSGAFSSYITNASMPTHNPPLTFEVFASALGLLIISFTLHKLLWKPSDSKYSFRARGHFFRELNIHELTIYLQHQYLCLAEI